VGPLGLAPKWVQVRDIGKLENGIFTLLAGKNMAGWTRRDPYAKRVGTFNN
jgi:hypothetical protein